MSRGWPPSEVCGAGGRPADDTRAEIPLGTAVAFHQIDLLGERGLSNPAAAANFLPQTAASLLATLTVGALVDRIGPRLVGHRVRPAHRGGGRRHPHPGGSSLPALLRTHHLGSIRGVVAAVSVGSTAFGPLAFALVDDATGGYTSALLASAVLPLLVAAAALVLPTPAPLDTAPHEDPAGEDALADEKPPASNC